MIAFLISVLLLWLAWRWLRRSMHVVEIAPSRREGGEGFFHSPRDARNMGAMMVMETDHETT